MLCAVVFCCASGYTEKENLTNFFCFPISAGLCTTHATLQVNSGTKRSSLRLLVLFVFSKHSTRHYQHCPVLKSHGKLSLMRLCSLQLIQARRCQGYVMIIKLLLQLLLLLMLCPGRYQSNGRLAYLTCCQRSISTKFMGEFVESNGRHG